MKPYEYFTEKNPEEIYIQRMFGAYELNVWEKQKVIQVDLTRIEALEIANRLYYLQHPKVANMNNLQRLAETVGGVNPFLPFDFSIAKDDDYYNALVLIRAPPDFPPPRVSCDLLVPRGPLSPSASSPETRQPPSPSGC